MELSFILTYSAKRNRNVMSGRTFNAFPILTHAKATYGRCQLTIGRKKSPKRPTRPSYIPRSLSHHLFATPLTRRDMPVKFVPSHIPFNDAGKPTFSAHPTQNSHRNVSQVRHRILLNR